MTKDKAFLTLAKYHYTRVISDTTLLLLFSIAYGCGDLITLIKIINKKIEDINRRLEETDKCKK